MATSVAIIGAHPFAVVEPVRRAGRRAHPGVWPQWSAVVGAPPSSPPDAEWSSFRADEASPVAGPASVRSRAAPATCRTELAGSFLPGEAIATAAEEP